MYKYHFPVVCPTAVYLTCTLLSATTSYSYTYHHQHVISSYHSFAPGSFHSDWCYTTCWPRQEARNLNVSGYILPTNGFLTVIDTIVTGTLLLCHPVPSHLTQSRLPLPQLRRPQLHLALFHLVLPHLEPLQTAPTQLAQFKPASLQSTPTQPVPKVVVVAANLALLSLQLAGISQIADYLLHSVRPGESHPKIWITKRSLQSKIVPLTNYPLTFNSSIGWVQVGHISTVDVNLSPQTLATRAIQVQTKVLEGRAVLLRWQ